MNIRRYLIFILTFFLAVNALSAQKNLSLIGQLPSPTNKLTDIWGYTDSLGNEYALIGKEGGFSIVDISTDPANPTELFYIDHVESGWRDIKTWESYAYVTNEDSGGLLIVDMTYLPDSIRYRDWDGGVFGSAHNIFIDENGVAYILGFNGSGGALFADLATDPYNPVFLGSYFTRYVHDAYVRGDTMWSAEINDGIFSVVDVSNKTNPVVLATKSTPSNFSHNIWLSDDGSTVYTTDEVSGAFIAAYNVSNLNNITEIDRYQFAPGVNYAPHNTHVVNTDFLITSYYRAGVVLNDVTYPDNIIEIGYYDTSPLTGGGFEGCWGVYPYYPSGTVVASDREEGLFILSPTYQQACYLQGLVTDSVTGLGIPGARIEIVGSGAETDAKLTGIYKTGFADAGSYDVSFSKPGYVSKTVNVSLSNGNVTLQNMVLAPAQSFSFFINVNVKSSIDPVPNAKALIVNDQFNIEASGNASGNIPVTSFFSGTYDVIVGAWGYETIELTDQVIDPTNNTINVELSQGYYDDFALDLEWTTSGTSASGGEWVKVDPKGTSFPSSPLLNPENDLPSDIGAECYVTGNTNEFDVVHGGSVFLQSPTFDIASYEAPYLSFNTRLVNFTFFGSLGDDSLIVTLSNGMDTVVLDQIYMTSLADFNWKLHTYFIDDYILPTSNMQVTFEAKSPVLTNYELLEVAVDIFKVVDSAAVTSVRDDISLDEIQFDFYPNPTDDYIQISYELPRSGTIHFEVLDLLGNIVDTYQTSYLPGEPTSHLYNTGQLQSGIYLVRMNFEDQSHVRKLVISQ